MAGPAAVFARKERTQTDTTTRSFFEWWGTGPFHSALEAERISALDAEATRRMLMFEDLELDAILARSPHVGAPPARRTRGAALAPAASG